MYAFTSNSDLSEIMFIAAFILFVIAAVIAWVAPTKPLWSIGFAGLACTAMGLFLL